MLCHFAVLLRERGIPGVIVGARPLTEGAYYTLDTSRVQMVSAAD
jgi:hypothetical protein